MARLNNLDKLEKLTNEEKETYISFDQTNAPANIFTYNSRWIKHLEKRMGLKPIFINEYGGRSYQCPKNKIPKPRADRTKRVFTEQQMQDLKKRGERLGKMRKTMVKSQPVLS